MDGQNEPKPKDNLDPLDKKMLEDLGLMIDNDGFIIARSITGKYVRVDSK